MSRIGKQPVIVPGGVTITVGNDNVITVKGPKGELTQPIDRDIVVDVRTVRLILPVPQTRSVIVPCMAFQGPCSLTL
jgi:large subunit ribosomal protein L6